MTKKILILRSDGDIEEKRVWNLKNYYPISLINGKILYKEIKKRGKKKRKKKEKEDRKKKRKKVEGEKQELIITEKEKKAIEKLKGKKSFIEKLRERQLLERVRESEKKILKQIKNIKGKEISLIRLNLNKKKIVIYENKVFDGFSDLNNNQVQVYRSLIEKLIKTKNEKFLNRLYELRSLILKEGLLIEVDLFGRVNKLRGKIHYLMSVGLVGLLIEEAGFLENLRGWRGEARNIVPYLDNQTRANNGKKAFLIRSNIAVDTGVVYIEGVKIKLSYA